MDGKTITKSPEQCTSISPPASPEDNIAAGVMEALGFTYHRRLGCGGEHNVCEVSRQDFLHGRHVALYTPTVRGYLTPQNREKAAEKLNTCFQYQQKLHEKGGYVPKSYQQGRVAYDDAEIPYMITECVGSGTTLYDCIRYVRGLSPPAAVRVALKIGETAAMLESEGEIHGDIKPENILLDRSRACLTDFTLARLLNLDPQPFFKGTPEYASLSYLETHNPADSDRHALALTFYEAIKGSRVNAVRIQNAAGCPDGIVYLDDIIDAFQKGILPLRQVTLISPEDEELANELDRFFAVAFHRDLKERHGSMHSLVSHLEEIWTRYVLPRNEEVCQQQEQWVRMATRQKKRAIKQKLTT